MIFLYLELGICPRALSLLTASLMCLGCRGGSSPHFSHTSRAGQHRESSGQGPAELCPCPAAAPVQLQREQAPFVFGVCSSEPAVNPLWELLPSRKPGQTAPKPLSQRGDAGSREGMSSEPLLCSPGWAVIPERLTQLQPLIPAPPIKQDQGRFMGGGDSSVPAAVTGSSFCSCSGAGGQSCHPGSA